MAGKRLQKPVKRKKKQGKALLISRLIRLGMLAVLLLFAWLVALGIDLCADFFRAQAPAAVVQEDSAPAPSPNQEAGLPATAQVRGIVTIDPGHGGADPGCGESDWLEKDLVLPIAMRLKQYLEAAGVTVVLTRHDDADLSLDRRAILANNAASDLFVSIHCNSYGGEARGMDCYYHKSEPAKQLAQSILDEAAALGIVTRQMQKNNYQVLWDTDMPAVLVETGFLTDPQDRAALQDPVHQDKIAQAITTAVVNYLTNHVA